MLSKVALVPKAEHSIVISENGKLNGKKWKTAREKRRFQDYRTYPWFAEIITILTTGSSLYMF